MREKKNQPKHQLFSGAGHINIPVMIHESHMHEMG